MTILYTRWRFDDYTQDHNFTFQKNRQKIRETLFTFKLYSAELLSF